MCGLTGVVDKRLQDQPHNYEHSLAAANEALAHRGPDGQGTYLDLPLGVGLAHVRLAIIDVEGGHQPLVSANGNVILVYNGEIYDFERQRQALEAEGYRFVTKTDSEVILNLYLRHGLDFFRHLRGEFAFLLLDKTQKRLLAVRDRFGIKPLYVARTTTGGWVFASEIKAMFAGGFVTPVIHPHFGLGDELATFFEGVEHVAPATAINIDLENGRHEFVNYWKPNLPTDESDATISMNEYACRVDDLLTESIRLRLRADVPVGLYLSGGIDSALVAAKVRMLASDRPKAFTVTFANQGARYNELDQARLIARHIDVEHHVLELTPENLWNALEACLWHAEGPIGDLAPVGKFLLSEFARRHVTVVLTGEGSDEAFLGYSAFYRSLTPPGPLQGLIARLGVSSKDIALLMLTRRFAERRIPATDQERPCFDQSQLTNRHSVRQLQYKRLKNHLMPVILSAYADRTEMAHSIEGRVPFLDHHLFDYAKTIPLTFNLRDGTEKRVLRQVCAGLLPDEITQHSRLRRHLSRLARPCCPPP